MNLKKILEQKHLKMQIGKITRKKKDGITIKTELTDILNLGLSDENLKNLKKGDSLILIYKDPSFIKATKNSKISYRNSPNFPLEIYNPSSNQTIYQDED
jgi:hypothetical protein